ncbi:transposon Ty3-I Gag-Pol polyprotein [Trichonephila clavipes]|nr:transposon Ty3-I Gag-Pol polyprotein [Trichonephila clavipes]
MELPRVIITDRGAVFRSRLVSSLVDLCNIDHRFTTAYHPQTNGLTERFNKTLADMLSMYVDVEQKNWDEISTICNLSLIIPLNKRPQVLRRSIYFMVVKRKRH